MINNILVFLTIIFAGVGVVYLINRFVDYIVDRKKAPLLIIHFRSGKKIKMICDEDVQQAIREWENTQFTVVRIKNRRYTFKISEVEYYEVRS